MEPVGKAAKTPTVEWAPIHLMCVFGTNEWLIEGNLSQNAIERWVFDGTNVIKSVQLTSVADEAELGGMTLEEAKSNVTVNLFSTPGGYPPGDVAADMCWLAFCSGSYLKRSNRIVPLPVPQATLLNAPDAFAYSDQTQTFEDELGLPRKLELFTSQSLYEASVAEFWKHKPPKNKALLKSMVPDGTRKFQYTVTSSTTFLGWNVPLSFEFVQGLPDDFRPALRSFRGTCIVRQVAESTEPTGILDPRFKTTVVDQRVQLREKGVKGVIYSWTNQYVPPTNEPLIQSELKASVDRIANERAKAH
jgi:hypothetical protein